MDQVLQEFAASFVESSREYVFVRREDNLMILRPNRVQYLNSTATEMLCTLYEQNPVDAAAVVAETASRYDVPEEQVAQDLSDLPQSLRLILNNQPQCAPAVRSTLFNTHERKYPVRGCGISQHWIDEWGAWAAGRPVLLATALSAADLRPKVGPSIHSWPSFRLHRWQRKGDRGCSAGAR